MPYAPIQGFPCHRVNEQGEVQSNLQGRWKPLKGRLDEHGRPRVSLIRDGVPHQRKVHRLVLEAFIGPCPPGLIGCHRDGDPTHNHIGNLYWGTYAENSADMVRHGRSQAGTKCHSAKIDEPIVLEIRRLRAQGLTLTRIGATVGLSFSQVGYILRGKKWKHVPATPMEGQTDGIHHVR